MINPAELAQLQNLISDSSSSALSALNTHDPKQAQRDAERAVKKLTECLARIVYILNQPNDK